MRQLNRRFAHCMPHFRQVAGRAGRYGSRFPTGIVTAMNPEDLEILADALQQPSDELQTAFVFPSLAQLEMLHSQHPKVRRAQGGGRGLSASRQGGRAPHAQGLCIALLLGKDHEAPLLCYLFRSCRRSCRASCACLRRQHRAASLTRTTGGAACSSCLGVWCSSCLASSACLHTQARFVCNAVAPPLFALRIQPPSASPVLHSYAKHDEVVTLAQMLRHLPLSLREAWTFAISPTDPDDVPVSGCLHIAMRGVGFCAQATPPRQAGPAARCSPLLDSLQVASALLVFATAYAARRRVTPASILLPPMVEARSELELQQVGSTACRQHDSGGRVALVCGRQRTLAMACLGVALGPACCPHVAAHVCIPTIMPTIRSGLPLAPPQLESSHRCLDLWLWLSFRFPDAWVGGEEVAERRAQLAQLIDASIRSMGLPRWGPMHRQAGPSALMLGQCDQLAAFMAADADCPSGQQCSGDSDPFFVLHAQGGQASGGSARDAH